VIYVMQVNGRVARIGFAVVSLLPWMIPVALIAQDGLHKVDALEQQVQKYLQEQKPQLAIPLLRKIVSIDTKNLNARANLGVLLFFQNGFAEAVPNLRAALKSQPDLWKIEALLGIAEKRTGDPANARDDLERAFPHLDEQKIRIEAGLELIELESAAAQFEKALSVAVKLEELAPQDPQILMAGYQIARQAMYQSLLNMTAVAPESAQMHMMMAGEMARQGNHAESIAHFRTALRLNPALPGAHFELAEQLRTSPDPELNKQAENEYKAALRVNPYDEFSWRELGGIMTAQGDFKGAEEDYGKALALQPKDSDAKTGLAIALISLDRTAEAITLLETAVKDDPTNMVAHFRLSGLYRRAGRTADADREMEAFHHYRDVKDTLGKVFKGLSGPASPQ
jgi:tetratricopeptide (TPR) repeat protein